jgi:adenine/guanine phosphoribosyltransferase-like PRPP-binding protein
MDITPLFLHPEALDYTVDRIAGWAREWEIDYGGVVAGCGFVIELAFLNGRERLKGYDVRSLVVVDDE